jgi:hypothetical protein
VDSFCYSSGKNDTVMFDYPKKITYSNNKECSGTNGVTTSLMTMQCFDWIESYGYSNDDGITAYGPYLTISYLPARTAAPTVSPSLSPTATPSISSAPSYSMNPTVKPNTISPSSIKPSTKPSSISTKNNSPQKPTFRPTRSPTLPFVDYQVDFKVSQVSVDALLVFSAFSFVFVFFSSFFLGSLFLLRRFLLLVQYFLSLIS